MRWLSNSIETNAAPSWTLAGFSAPAIHVSFSVFFPPLSLFLLWTQELVCTPSRTASPSSCQALLFFLCSWLSPRSAVSQSDCQRLCSLSTASDVQSDGSSFSGHANPQHLLRLLHMRRPQDTRDLKMLSSIFPLYRCVWRFPPSRQETVTNEQTV